MIHPTGNTARRPPLCPVTRAMADAGRARMQIFLDAEADGIPASDDRLVSEVFAAMWQVYWDQVFTLQGKQLKAPAHLILPPRGIATQ